MNPDVVPGAARPPLGDAVIVPTTVLAPPPRQKSAVETRFREGEMVPLKGIWFRVEKIDGLGMVLLAHDYTGRGRKKK